MVTFSQLLKNTRKKIKTTYIDPILNGSPQRRGICVRLYVINPKKPNSALRKVSRVALTTKHEITAFIPGESHTLYEHAVVLVRGGKTKDLPGVKHKIIRGALDCIGALNRKNGRSKYGTTKKKYNV